MNIMLASTCSEFFNDEFLRRDDVSDMDKWNDGTGGNNIVDRSSKLSETAELKQHTDREMINEIIILSNLTVEQENRKTTGKEVWELMIVKAHTKTEESLSQLDKEVAVLSKIFDDRTENAEEDKIPDDKDDGNMVGEIGGDDPEEHSLLVEEVNDEDDNAQDGKTLDEAQVGKQKHKLKNVVRATMQKESFVNTFNLGMDAMKKKDLVNIRFL